MRVVRWVYLWLICASAPAFAIAPEVSPRPVLRPVQAGANDTTAEPQGSTQGFVIISRDVPGVWQSPRPVPRGGVGRVVAEDTEFIASDVGGVVRSPRPVLRPANLVSNSMRSALVAEVVPDETPRRQPRRGSVCRDRTIRGEELESISGDLDGCGISDPVRVTEIDGVVLSQPSIMECDTAEAIRDWIDDGIRPAIGMLGGGLASLHVAAHYSCRTRNSQPGARISEHGKGRAIDIAAFELRNGTVIDVEDGWDDPVQGRVLRDIHESACGTFRTVLGPDADQYHQDHFHVDNAQRRGRDHCN